MSIAEKLTAIAQNEKRVYEAGKQADRDAFWDDFQQRGNRENYSYAFNHWSHERFEPKYDIKATDLQYAFRYSTITDLKGVLEAQGVTLDVSNATNLMNVFYYADSLTTCPTIDVSKGLLVTFNVFTHAHAMKSIEKVIFPTGKVMTFTNSFHTCTALEDIVIEGDIMANGLSFQWSKNLTHDSLLSIINALYDYSNDTSGTTWTLTIGAENYAKLSEKEIESVYAKGWNLA